MKNMNYTGICRYTRALIILLIFTVSIIPVMATPLTSNRHIFINVANDAGVKYDLDGAKYGGPANTYYIKSDGGGLNELHITNNADDAYGQVTTTSDQSGTFYVTNTGGRGFDNDIILLIAVKEPVPEDFSVTIRSSGYTWTPAASGAYTPKPPTDYTYVTTGVSETFTKSDFIYGPQTWKPGPGALGDTSLPIFNGEDMADASNQFQLMFIDLKAGNMYPNKFPGVSLTDNGAVKVEYSFTNLHTFASFNGYGWCSAANQNQGISWTNPTKGFTAGGGAKQSGQSGFSVTGVSSSPSSGRRASSSGGAGLPSPGAEVPADPFLYGYKGKAVSAEKSGTVNGSVRIFSDPDAGPVPVSNRIRDVTLDLDLPPGSNISFARMYLYVSDSQYIQGGKGVIPSISTRLNATILAPDAMYVDTDGDDRKQVAATSAYDVRNLLTGNGTYTFSVRNTDQDQSVFTLDGVLLVTAYDQENGTPTRYWINEGCDAILCQPEKELFPEDSETGFSFSGAVNTSTARDAQLFLVATGLDRNASTDHTVRFNKGSWINLFDNESVRGNTTSALVVQLPVNAYLNETGNTAAVQSSIRLQDPDYIVNRNAFLIVGQHEQDSSASAENSTGFGTVEEVSDSGSPDTALSAGEGSCCRITLDSDPKGALIYMDGTYLGKTTPDSLEIQQGDMHTFRFELDGYVPSDVQITATNSTSIRPSLYTAVHSTKGRLTSEPVDPDGTRYGGLYVYSRPRSAEITLNGVNTGKVTPAVFMGLEPGIYTVKLGRLRDFTVLEENTFVFPDQTVRVLPEVITPVDISGIGNHEYADTIIDSRRYRGLPFTVNGYVNNKTVPAKINSPVFDSFVTFHENESFISYTIPVPYLWDETRYLLFEPREYQDLSISVSSSPPGADVFIDGFGTKYTTPYIFGNISDGTHRITVTKEGYLPEETLINLPRRSVPISTTPVDFVLEEYPSGFLYVSSIPEGGRVSIDNIYTGEVTPALFRSMPTGSHYVEVTLANATKKFYDVTINSLSMTNLTADFTPKEDW